MPNQPEREIEKTLKAYAEQRRADAGAPRELHPATRRLLQGEAGRVHPRTREGKSFWSRSSWPQFAIGFALLAVIAIWRFFPPLNDSISEMKSHALAFAPQATEPVTKSLPAPAESPVGVRPEPAHTEAFKQDRNMMAAQPSHSLQPAPAPMALDDIESSKRALDGVRAKSVQTNVTAFAETFTAGKKSEGGVQIATGLPPSSAVSTTVTAPPIRPEPTPRLAVAPAAALAEPPPAVATISGDTVTVAPASAAAPADQSLGSTFAESNLNPVAKKGNGFAALASFQVEMTGDRIRIVDADGSIYSGQLQRPAALSEKAKDVPRAAAKPAPTGNARIRRRFVATTNALGGFAGNPAGPGELYSSNYFFTVAGTNRTLRQKVVFAGNFSGNAKVDVLTGAQDSPPPPAAFGFDNSSSEPLKFSDLHISGRAVVGTNHLDISAKAKN